MTLSVDIVRAIKEVIMKRNVLTAPRMFELIRWLQKNKDRLLEERPAYSVVAKRATIELGFTVTENNVHTAAQIGQCAWRAKPTGRHIGVVDHPSRHLAQEIVRIEEHLGMNISLPILVLARDPRADALLLATRAVKPA